MSLKELLGQLTDDAPPPKPKEPAGDAPESDPDEAPVSDVTEVAHTMSVTDLIHAAVELGRVLTPVNLGAHNEEIVLVGTGVSIRTKGTASGFAATVFRFKAAVAPFLPAEEVETTTEGDEDE